MRITNLNFANWSKNHSEHHDDKWCRELYPFNVFSRIDFDDSKIEVEQKIDFDWVHYFVTIKKIELQDNGRFRATFDFVTHPQSKRQAWINRTWNSTFQIIYTSDYRFITVYTKKLDPSKDYVIRFMKGDIRRISDNKSLPISELLFRTLLLQLSEESYPNGQNNMSFPFLPEGIRPLTKHPEFIAKQLDFAPIYSVGRTVWICYSFSEEKAHRIAYYIADQCQELIVVFCNPTYTRHHRCSYEKTQVLSLYEYANRISANVRKKYEYQIRFLQNHLNSPIEFDINWLLNEINNPTMELYPINKSDLMEALGIMKVTPNDELDMLYYASGMNLINAYLTRQSRSMHLEAKEHRLFRNMYFFKSYLASAITETVNRPLPSVSIFLQNGLAMIEVRGFQFSFHSVPMNVTLSNYEKSESNKQIVWSGKRLQPVAPLVFHYAQMLRQSH